MAKKLKSKREQKRATPDALVKTRKMSDIALTEQELSRVTGGQKVDPVAGDLSATVKF
jgi:hypothetical protein